MSFLKDKLDQSFAVLRKKGYFARQDFWCCQTCGCAAVPELYADHYVFYHHQDAEDLHKDGGTHVCWAGDGQEICDYFRASGLAVDWDGSPNTRIWVGLRQ